MEYQKTTMRKVFFLEVGEKLPICIACAQDFIWLHDVIQENLQYAGFIIPPKVRVAFILNDSFVHQDLRDCERKLLESRAEIIVSRNYRTPIYRDFQIFEKNIVSNLQYRVSRYSQNHDLLRIQLKLNTALLSHCPCVRPCDIAHFSHI